jgi:hypothetical protein
VLWASFISSSDPIPDVPMSKGVVMADGSALACESLLRADTDIVRLDATGADGRNVVVKTADVARIVLAALPAELLKRVPPGAHGGVLLDGGDFVEGEFRGIDGGKVRISSVLFGLQSFDAGRQAVAVILRDAHDPDAPLVARLANGSVLAGKTVSFERGITAISVEDQHFGTIVAPVKDLIDVRAGGERLMSLADLKPGATGTQPSNGSKPYAIDATTCGTPPSLLGLVPRRAIGQANGAPLSFDLGDGQQYTSLVARAGVPAALVPAGRARFVVLVDGAEKFKSEGRTSVDDPLAVAVSLKGAKIADLARRAGGGKRRRPGHFRRAGWGMGGSDPDQSAPTTRP